MRGFKNKNGLLFAPNKILSQPYSSTGGEAHPCNCLFSNHNVLWPDMPPVLFQLPQHFSWLSTAVWYRSCDRIKWQVKPCLSEQVFHNCTSNCLTCLPPKGLLLGLFTALAAHATSNGSTPPCAPVVVTPIEPPPAVGHGDAAAPFCC